MAVTDIREIKERQHVVTVKNERRYVRTWYCLTDDPDDGGKTVELAFVAETGIQQGDSYSTPNETDTNAKALEFSTNCVDPDGRGWEVTVTYGKFDSTSSGTDPLGLPPKYSTNFNPTKQIVDYDYLGQPIVNSSGSFFSPPVEEDKQRLVLQVERNETWPFDEVFGAAYTGAINSTPWRGWPVYTVLCRKITSTDELDQTYGKFCRVVYQFEFEPLTWLKVLLDAGYQYKDGSGNLHDILVDGQKTTVPKMLDGAGGILPDGDPPQYLTFYTKKLLPFTVFTF